MVGRITLVGLLVYALWVLCGTPARAADRPDLEGTSIGALDVSTGIIWQDKTSASFQCTTTATSCSSSLTFAQVLIVNTHATATLYVQFKAGASEALTNQITIPAGGSMTLPVYGLKVRTLSVKGSTTSVTGFIIAWLFPY